ncbi:hypothetical protein KSF78_0009172 [Schistosoma japonicum]|nr:hypothetical protein KSF78_0009172 [Schistosoma japonicum]
MFCWFIHRYNYCMFMLLWFM